MCPWKDGVLDTLSHHSLVRERVLILKFTVECRLDCTVRIMTDQAPQISRNQELQAR